MNGGGPEADDIASAAHELNNLCAAMMGFAALAHELAPPSSLLTGYLEEILQSAQSAAKVAEHLRAVSLQLRPPSDR